MRQRGEMRQRPGGPRCRLRRSNTLTRERSSSAGRTLPHGAGASDGARRVRGAARVPEGAASGNSRQPCPFARRHPELRWTVVSASSVSVALVGAEVTLEVDDKGRVRRAHARLCTCAGRVRASARGAVSSASTASSGDATALERASVLGSAVRAVRVLPLRGRGCGRGPRLRRYLGPRLRSSPSQGRGSAAT